MSVRTSPRRASVTLLAAATLLSTGCDRAKPDYTECVRLDGIGSFNAAEEACRRAVAADPNSASGKAAAVWLTNHEAYKKRLLADALQTKTEIDALVDKYRKLSPDQRRAALEKCFEPSSECSDRERNAIVAAAADDEERKAMQRFVDNRAPRHAQQAPVTVAAGAASASTGCPFKSRSECEFACKVNAGLKFSGSAHDEKERFLEQCADACVARCSR